jgi:hypothetical protein
MKRLKSQVNEMTNPTLQLLQVKLMTFYLILESRSRAQLHVLCNLGPAAIHPHHLHLATTNCVAAHHQPYLTLTQIFQTNPIPYLVSTMLHR